MSLTDAYYNSSLSLGNWGAIPSVSFHLLVLSPICVPLVPSVPGELCSLGPVRRRVLPRHLEYLVNPPLRRVPRVRQVLEQGQRAGVAANLVRRRRAAQNHGLKSLQHRDGDGGAVSLVHERVESPGRGPKVARELPKYLHDRQHAFIRVTRRQTAVRQRLFDDDFHSRFFSFEQRGPRALLHDVPRRLDAVEKRGAVGSRHIHRLA
mmetsp:Transcript_7774/g.35246  ORF Transcript_7774/g.35246 Transcript_7774/m.35246 type:complete len:207 (+) Transcript_7774:882-1502(+)